MENRYDGQLAHGLAFGEVADEFVHEFLYLHRMQRYAVLPSRKTLASLANNRELAEPTKMIIFAKTTR